MRRCEWWRSKLPLQWPGRWHRTSERWCGWRAVHHAAGLRHHEATSWCGIHGRRLRGRDHGHGVGVTGRLGDALRECLAVALPVMVPRGGEKEMQGCMASVSRSRNILMTHLADAPCVTAYADKNIVCDQAIDSADAGKLHSCYLSSYSHGTNFAGTMSSPHFSRRLRTQVYFRLALLFS